MRPFFKSVFTVIFIIAFSCALPAAAKPEGESILGKVVGVHDGDTITILTPYMEELKIRLGEIDAPELKQPYGQKAKQMLSDMVFGKEVVIIKTDRDRYGRTVGRVYLGEEDINRAMAAQGGAWAYLQYLSDNAILEAQNAAQSQKIGVWALQADQVTAPWEWRKAQRQGDGETEPDTLVTPPPAAPTAAQDPGLWEPLPEEYPYPRQDSAFDSPPPAPAQKQGSYADAPAAPAPAQTCTKRCNKGKPCGDACIPQDRNCTKPPGKAC